MIDFIFFIIGSAFAIYFTVDFLISLWRDKTSIIGKTWNWIVNVFDSLLGIG